MTSYSFTFCRHCFFAIILFFPTNSTLLYGQENPATIPVAAQKELENARKELENARLRYAELRRRRVSVDFVLLKKVAGELHEKLGSNIFLLQQKDFAPPKIHSTSVLTAAVAISQEDPEKVKQFFLSKIKAWKGVRPEIALLPFEQIKEILSEAYDRKLYSRPINLIHAIVADQALYDDLRRRQGLENLSIQHELSFMHWMLSVPENKRIEFQKQYLELYAFWPRSAHISAKRGYMRSLAVFDDQSADLSDEFLRWVILGREAAPEPTFVGPRAEYGYFEAEYGYLDRLMNRRAILVAGKLKRQHLVGDIFNVAKRKHVDVWAACVALWKLREFVSVRDVEKLMMSKSENRDLGYLRDLTDLSELLGALGDKEAVDFLQKLSLDEKYSDHLRKSFGNQAMDLQKRLAEGTEPRNYWE